MASQQAEAIKELIRSQVAEGLGQDRSLEEMRATADDFGLLTTEPEGVTWTEVDAGGVPAIWADPPNGASDRVLHYVHGGGYVIGTAASYKRLCGHLAKAIGCRVLIVDYGLAPEHPHPGPVNDSVTAFRWLLDQGYEPAHLAVAGDSAGGGLTLSTVLKLRADGLPQPSGAVPLSPWADLECLGASMQSNADKDVLVQEVGVKGMAEMFLAGGDARDPLASPIHADFAGICPLYIQVGGDETLLDDAVRVEQAARRDGVDVTLEVFPEMQHVFQMAAGNMPEADDAIARIGAWLRPRLGLV
ncbi:MAG: alpha/beta hydrolase [Acidimicrobiaceae bacterium]|nr:alpha/beta hydrolase [Acidimicrobiaceae bacterium]